MQVHNLNSFMSHDCCERKAVKNSIFMTWFMISYSGTKNNLVLATWNNPILTQKDEKKFLFDSLLK